MPRLVSLAAAVAVALTLVGSASSGAAATKLVGTVGPGFTISLKMGGKTVKTLKAGKYTITVTDRSNIHNFRLKGAGVNKEITTVPFVGKKTVTLTLKRGKYTYVCDPHPPMKGSFRVS